MMASQPLMQLHGATLQLGSQDFGPFDLTLAAGESVALLGPSGAGKSTLLKLMAGERAPFRGEVLLDQRPLRAGRAATLARRRAMLPQQHAVAFAMPASLVVALGRFAAADDSATARIVPAALAMAHAGHLAQRRFDTLSGGEQARVQLARTLAQLWDVEQGLLLVDEPLAALDPGLQLELLGVLQAFARQRGHALVAIVHDLNQALAGFERLWLVRQGRLVADLPAGRDALPALASLFGVRLQAVDGDDGSLGVLVRSLEPPRPGTEALAA